MHSYELKPKSGWEDYPRNIELVNYIYSSFMPLVNEGKWCYMNFMTGSGIFEDEYGNWVILELNINDEDEDEETTNDIEPLIELRVRIENANLNKTEFLEKTMINIEKNYELQRFE